MSRLEPTPEEKAAGDALIEKFTSDGHKISHTKFSDRPDLELIVDGIPMGFEIVGLIPEDMQQAIRTFSNVMYRRNVDVAKITIPIEPDMWAKTVIERKWAKVQKYDKTVFTEGISLLIHYPMLGARDPVEYGRPEFLSGIHYGKAEAAHGFTNIYYWSGMKVHKLHAERRDLLPKTYPDLTNGYPAYVIWIMSAGKEGLSQRFKDRDVPLLQKPENTKHIKPMTDVFKKIGPNEPKQDLRFELVIENKLDINTTE